MMKSVRSYVENGVTVYVFPTKLQKRVPWQKNDTFYAAKMRVEDNHGMFTTLNRKRGRG